MTWDSYFMEIAKTVSINSKCQSRKIGAVIVTQDNRLVSSGYNGAPSHIDPCYTKVFPITAPDGHKMLIIPEGSDIKSYETNGRYREDRRDVVLNEHSECPRYVAGYRSGQGMQYCPAQHAEENCVHTAALLGVATRGTKMYCYCPTPCVHCCGAIINAGIVEVVCASLKEYQDEVSSLEMFKQAGVKVRLAE
jgi:dCMP deaminase